MCVWGAVERAVQGGGGNVVWLSGARRNGAKVCMVELMRRWQAGSLGRAGAALHLGSCRCREAR